VLPNRSELPATKRQQILVGARQVFLETGFSCACVDVIAARAGVSKATVYNHFTDKKALFIACFLEEAEALRAQFTAHLASVPGTDVREALQGLGERLVALLIKPDVVSIYRITLAEIARLPELGPILYERGAATTRACIASFLEDWRDAGALVLDDPGTAALQLSMLCQGDLVWRAWLGLPPDDETIRANVCAGVELFLRAYGCDARRAESS
jgi:AcrR family transcriptional regulator